MVTYTCKRCLKEFNKKCNYIDHTEKKKSPCQQILIQPSQILQPPSNTLQSPTEKPCYICEHCDTTFTRKDNLSKHLKNSCKIKKEQDEKDKQLKLQAIQIQELKQQMEVLIQHIDKKPGKKIKTQNNITNNNNNSNTNTNSNNTINNNIVNNIIVAHGSEDLSKIELNTIMEHLATVDYKNIIPNMARHIYINKDKPENKNFRIVDLARNKCEYNDGKKWVAGKTNEKILKIFDNVNSMLTKPFEKDKMLKTIEFIENNPKLKKNSKFIKYSKNYCESLFDDNDKENIEKKNEVINELKYVFYNYRDEILKN